MGQRNLRFAVVMGLHTLISAGTYLLGKAAADATRGSSGGDGGGCGCEGSASGTG